MPTADKAKPKKKRARKRNRKVNPNAKPVEEQPKRIVKSLREVAMHFEVDAATVQKWRGWYPPMPGDRNAYDLDEIAKWRETARSQVDKRMEDQGTGLAHERLKTDVEFRKAKLEAIERENKMREGGLVQIEDVSRWASEFFSELRRHAMSIPIEMRQGYDEEIGAAIEQDARGRIEDLLLAMHSYVISAQDIGREMTE